MSVQRVVLTSSDEAYAPPSREIELSVISGRLFIKVFEGSDDDRPSTKKREYEVPELWLSDVLNALAAFDQNLVQHRAFSVGFGEAIEAAEKCHVREGEET